MFRSPLFDIFDDFFYNPAGVRAIPVDVSKEGEGYAVKAIVPGFDETEVNVEVVNNHLTITAGKQSETSKSSFVRRISLPETVDSSGIVAELDKGVLTVRLPVSETAKPRQISVTVPKAIET